MSENSWSAEDLLARAAEAGVLNILRMHGFVGGEIHEGTAVRILSKKGRTFRDMVFFEAGPETRVPLDGIDGESVILSRSTFPISSETGPVVLIDSTLTMPAAAAMQWLEVLESSSASSFDRGTARPLSSLDDEKFWELISLLEGVVTEASCRRLVKALAQLPDRDIQEFSDLLAQKLYLLDDPGNVVGAVDETVSADASLYYRCEIIARGETEYAARLAAPERGQGSAGQSGELLLSVVSDASRQPIQAPPVTYETGSNRALWADLPPAGLPFRPDPPRSLSNRGQTALPGPFSMAMQLSRLDLVTQRPGRFISFTAYAIGESATREVIGCLMARSSDAALPEVRSFLRARLRDEGMVKLRIVLNESGVDGPTVWVPLAVTERKLSLDLNEYLRDVYLQELHRS